MTNSYFGIVSLFNGLFSLLAACYVLLKNRKNPVYLGFASFGLTVALWAIFYAFWQFQTSKTMALFFMRLAMVPCYYIPFGFLGFVLALTEDERLKKFLPFCLAIPTFFLLFSFSELMVRDVTPRLYFSYWPTPGLLMHLFVILFFTTVSYAFYLLFRTWFRSTGMRRWQIKWVTLTTLCAWAGGSTNWFLWYNIPIPPGPNAAVGIVFLLLFYAIRRRQLFDIDTLADLVQEAKLSAMGTMTASITHEIRNPLFVAKGLIESFQAKMKEGCLRQLPIEEGEKKLDELFNKTLDQIGRAVEIMKRFSELSKPRSGTITKEEVSVVDVLNNVLSCVEYELATEKIKVEKQLDSQSRIRTDRKHMEEIFFNLIMNACQAMPKGGMIKIGTEQKDGCTRISISDTGDGITRDRIKRIFDPFFSTKDEKGTGLGLYIVKKLTERNGGKVTVQSSVGRGTKFILEFPSGGRG